MIKPYTLYEQIAGQKAYIRVLGERLLSDLSLVISDGEGGGHNRLPAILKGGMRTVKSERIYTV